jgi:DNA-binding CsgD family transcriptional regulator
MSLEQGWHIALAEAIQGLDTPRFAPSLARALRRVASFTYTVMFAFRGEERPLDLFDDFGPARRSIYVTDYQAGPYLLDPFYHAARGGIAPGLYRMRDLAPDRFYQSEYYRSYYVQTGLAEEIGFFLRPAPGVTVTMSLMRVAGTAAFTAREMARLRVAAPVVIALAERNWRGLAQRFAVDAAAPSADDPPSDAFTTFGRHRLTQRESEIVSLVLRGHSSEAIGVALGITAGTVKIHRKNIYAKLGIGSQAELFSLFVHARSGDRAQGELRRSDRRG